MSAERQRELVDSLIDNLPHTAKRKPASAKPDRRVRGNGAARV